MSGRSYEVLDHTADLALRVWGRDLADLLAAAIEAMLCEVFADYRRPRAATGARRVVLETGAHDAESLLVGLLNEVLYLAEVDGVVPLDPEVQLRTGNRAILTAQVLSTDQLNWTRELKAVTYHGLRIARTPDGGLEATVIFDL